MIYRTTTPFELEKFKTRAKALIKKGAVVELKEKTKKRTNDQNAYLHVLFSLYAIEYGYTLQEAKDLVKGSCPFMNYEKNGHQFIRGTSSLDTQEMTQFIDWFRNWSASEGCYLPTPNEYRQEQYYFENEINKAKAYL